MRIFAIKKKTKITHTHTHTHKNKHVKCDMCYHATHLSCGGQSGKSLRKPKGGRCDAYVITDHSDNAKQCNDIIKLPYLPINYCGSIYSEKHGLFIFDVFEHQTKHGDCPNFEKRKAKRIIYNLPIINAKYQTNKQRGTKSSYIDITDTHLQSLQWKQIACAQSFAEIPVIAIYDSTNCQSFDVFILSLCFFCVFCFPRVFAFFCQKKRLQSKKKKQSNIF